MNLPNNIVTIVGLLTLAGLAAAQTPQLTVEVGSPAGGAMVGQTVQIPVMITSAAEQPTLVIVVLEFDETELTFVEASAGPIVPAGKSFQSFLDTEEAPARLALIIFGIDRVPIPNGTIFIVDFEVNAASDGGIIPITLVEDKTSATTVDPEEFAITAIDGGIDVTCATLDIPRNVQATTNRSDAVLVTWGDVEGAAEYRVFRGAGNATSPAEAAAISDWITASQFLDTTAPGPISMGAFGCTVDPVTVRYWVQARERPFCESEFGGPASGSRAPVGSKAATGDVAASNTGAIAMLLAACIALRLTQRRAPSTMNLPLNRVTKLHFVTDRTRS